MTKRKQSKPQSGSRKRHSRPKRRSRGLALRRAASGDHWIFDHPRCVRERAEDIEEIHSIIAANEEEIAIDELRWLLEECNDFLEAHQLLGQLTLNVSGDVALARAHFGCAFQLGQRAIKNAKMEGTLPYRQPANQPFFDAGKGLSECLIQLKKQAMAREVLEQLVSLDPSDPLGLRAMVDDLATGGLPIVELE